MAQDFKGKVAFVTGGSDGIGRATAMLIARRGAHTVICARQPERLAGVAEEIAAAGGGAEAIALDASDLEALDRTIRDVAARHGRLDLMVNNAASTHHGPISKLKIEHWRKDFALNADAVFVATKAAMGIMKAGGGGSIVNVSSSCGLRAPNFMSSYSASKAALTHFSACAAMEGARDGIRVNVVVPGQVQTQATVEFGKKAPATKPSAH